MSLKVRPGTVHVLVGENGAGKSTLMKILSGIYAIDGGEILFRGEKLDHQSAAAALDRGISMIHQELSPVLDMTIAENIFLGREPTYGRTGILSRFVDFDRMNSDTQTLLDRLGLKYSPQTKMRDLSIATMQLIEIVKAISREASGRCAKPLAADDTSADRVRVVRYRVLHGCRGAVSKGECPGGP
ncbi:ATP-binding cassette domain-containing protein [Rhizobium leguminosarum]|uniref:ATP-binding cassette domain-containing protein n=1 Tax=Rhizobium leguminosarum TaxID=384 RepID=UPI001FDF18AE|nr:ATP-binding cassette domain-containing protein [Rhizobium leguminosarum]